MIEQHFDVPLISRQARREKQSQQTYRPVIGVHKWFARRAGSLFRGILLSEFASDIALKDAFFQGTALADLVVSDPFMGGGSPIFEAVRLGCSVIGCDVNPVAYWVVRQEISAIDRELFIDTAQSVIDATEKRISSLYQTTCTECGNPEAAAKYFFWAKQATCEACSQSFDLLRNFLLALDERHPNYVVLCPHCARLVECRERPGEGRDIPCPECGAILRERGPAHLRSYTCPHCQHKGKYPSQYVTGVPARHRLLGMEYHCSECYGKTDGRLFKTPDSLDLHRYCWAGDRLGQAKHLRPVLPDLTIPDGMETRRLHQWSYSNYRQLFNDRQLLALGELTHAILGVAEPSIRHALSTVLSDVVRYHNVLCRYDSYALKGQDVFAVHSFPVPLVYCESNVLGIPGVGSGSFRRFAAKYERAKAYCENPFETRWFANGSKEKVPIEDECIVADLVKTTPARSSMRSAFLWAGKIEDIDLSEGSLDAVLTDPPYYDNVQYGELTDLHFAWLKPLLSEELEAFRRHSSRSPHELTIGGANGNSAEDFSDGLSRAFCHLSKALKPGAPFVFTYHHSTLEAYFPLVVALLDARLQCTATFPYPAEMLSSLHISQTSAPIVDTVVVSRKPPYEGIASSEPFNLQMLLSRDRGWLTEAGFVPQPSDLKCLAYGHTARAAVETLYEDWNSSDDTSLRLARVRDTFAVLLDEAALLKVVQALTSQRLETG